MNLPLLEYPGYLDVQLTNKAIQGFDKGHRFIQHSFALKNRSNATPEKMESLLRGIKVVITHWVNVLEIRSFPYFRIEYSKSPVVWNSNHLYVIRHLDEMEVSQLLKLLDEGELKYVSFRFYY